MKYLIRRIVKKLIDIDILGIFFINYIKVNVIFEKNSGRIFQLIGNRKIFISHSKHSFPITGKNEINLIDWLCENVYYNKYLPKSGDVILDIGTGYGHEIVWLNEKTSNVNFVCIEPNPEVFCYLRLNTSHIKNVDLINCFVGNNESVTFSINLDYASSDSINSSDFGWKIDGIRLNNVLEKYEKVDLLKLNIEGGELELLTNNNLDKINRIIVSCHDFRAIRGDGDFFYTYKKVSNSLIEKGYRLQNLEISEFPNSSWESSIPFWIFAEKIK